MGAMLFRAFTTDRATASFCFMDVFRLILRCHSFLFRRICKVSTEIVADWGAERNKEKVPRFASEQTTIPCKTV